MVIQKYTNNLYSSEVYRELERQAVKKGFFKPSDEILVKNAADMATVEAKVNAKVSTEPTDDLIQDVARLAYALRRKGFVSYAEDIENKLVMYKRAEKNLYDVTNETNQDFIDLAHKDGDVQIIEGAGELGQIETQQSLAEKILAVVNKEPTGKMGMLASLILKNAQEEATQGTSDDIQRVAKTYQSLASKLQTFPEVQGITFSGQFDFTNPAYAKVYSDIAAAAGAAKLSPDAIVKSAQAFKDTTAMLGGNPLEPNSWVEWLGSVQDAQTVSQKARELGVDSSILTGFSSLKWGSVGGAWWSVANSLEDMMSRYDEYDWAPVKGRFQQNAKSIFSAVPTASGYTVTGFTPVVNNQNATAAGPAFCTAFINKMFVPVYGQGSSILEKASEYLEDLPKKISAKVRGLADRLKVPANVSDELGNLTPEAYTGINSVEAELNKIWSDNETKLFQSSYTALGSKVQDQLEAWKTNFDMDVSNAEREISSSGHGQTINVNSTLSDMNKLIATYQEVGKNFGIGSAQYTAALNNAKKILRIKSSLEKIGHGQPDKPIVLVLQKLNEIGFKSIDELNSALESFKPAAQKALDASKKAKGKSPGVK